MSTVLTVGGCAPSMRLETPPPVLSVDWSIASSVAAPKPSSSLAQMLAAPALDALTRQALADNSDVRIAFAKVRQARALLRAARRAGLPEITVSAGTNRSLSNSSSSAFDAGEGFAQIDAEIDLDPFGRIKAGKRSAVARARAAELDRHALSLAIEAGVATAYVDRAALAERIAILDRNIARATDLERIIRARAREGDASKVDIGIQSGQLLDLKASRVDLVQALDRTRTALAVLVGAEAPRFQVEPARLDSFAQLQISPSPPAQLLAARPDIRAAEALIEAANGDVAQARASFFPTISLSGRGLIDTVIGSGPLSTAVSFGSSLVMPIFARRRLERDFEVASASQVEAVERYRGAIVAALSEVENALSAIARANEREELLAATVSSARETAELARIQYVEGDVDLQRVLDAEQALGNAENAQALSRQTALLARISLYQAMGGSH